MNRILVIQTAFLGDVILATPVVSELHRLYPDASIDVLVKKGNESLLENNPKLNAVHVFNKKDGKLKGVSALIKTFRKNNYDLVINLHRFGSSGIIAGFSGGKKVIGFKKNPFSFLYTEKYDHQIGDGTHEVERNLSLIRKLGGKKSVRPELYPSETDHEKVHPYAQGKYVTMAPASVWFTKQLPKEKWTELIEQQSEDTTIYLLGAPGDKALCNELISLANSSNVVNLAGELTLLQSAALMQNAQMNFVNDSGPLHLASSMNAPTTAFFCSTVPSFGFGPLADISIVKEVNGLDCRPCGLHGHKECPKGHFKCGYDISI
ncbi:MAG: glycosyltransferase family 9 protein [Crocinitomicaceae bacterium]